MAFLYFDMSFMVWTMLGPLSTEISEALAATGFIITAGQKATLLFLWNGCTFSNCYSYY